jgi:hypothetical protein
MAIITSTVKAGQGPSKAEWERIKAELREAKRHPIVYDEDCPKLTPAQLAEFEPVDGVTWEERAKNLMRVRSPFPFERDEEEDKKIMRREAVLAP